MARFIDPVEKLVEGHIEDTCDKCRRFLKDKHDREEGTWAGTTLPIRIKVCASCGHENRRLTSPDPEPRG